MRDLLTYEQVQRDIERRFKAYCRAEAARLNSLYKAKEKQQ